MKEELEEGRYTQKGFSCLSSDDDCSWLDGPKPYPGRAAVGETEDEDGGPENEKRPYGAGDGEEPDA